MSPNSISDLELFVEKSEWLESSNFYKTVQRDTTGTTYSYSKERGEEYSLLGPEGECIDAAILTLRMFMQNNERISIQNMSKIFEGEDALSEFRADFRGISERINERLSENGNIYIAGKGYTMGETLNLFLYGSRAHANREKAEELKGILSRDSYAVTCFMDNINYIMALLIANISCIARLAKQGITKYADV
jgi:hypothetical protein